VPWLVCLGLQRRDFKETYTAEEMGYEAKRDKLTLHRLVSERGVKTKIICFSLSLSSPASA
jgi:hypothetical protein